MCTYMCKILSTQSGKHAKPPLYKPNGKGMLANHKPGNMIINSGRLPTIWHLKGVN